MLADRQKVNNLKFVYKLKNNGEKTEKWKETERMLKINYPDEISTFTKVEKGK